MPNSIFQLNEKCFAACPLDAVAADDVDNFSVATPLSSAVDSNWKHNQNNEMSASDWFSQQYNNNHSNSMLMLNTRLSVKPLHANVNMYASSVRCNKIFSKFN